MNHVMIKDQRPSLVDFKFERIVRLIGVVILKPKERLLIANLRTRRLLGSKALSH
jgi:hypothetical protein